jgi:hypothetical protein
MQILRNQKQSQLMNQKVGIYRVEELVLCPPALPHLAMLNTYLDQQWALHHHLLTVNIWA